jgi:hypothetical protein
VPARVADQGADPAEGLAGGFFGERHRRGPYLTHEIRPILARGDALGHDAAMVVFSMVVGGALAALLTVAWRMDRAVRRRGSRVTDSGDLWREVRESRRDAEVTSPFSTDNSWSSWSRRNRG